MVNLGQDGLATFRLYRPGASHVEVQGDFTGWGHSSLVMTREESGWWSASVRLEPGQHEFQYVIDGREWIADYAATGVRRNAFGLWVSQLWVPRVVVATERRSARAA
ncbi:MAG: hypothetical protein KDA21_04985 [Phycisphaerales bacterium]|nr:hypothetical protein [Phycisphaerales bacterium]